MTRKHNIFCGSDLYEVTIRDQTIISIVKWFGHSQLQRELSFEECPQKVQLEIVRQMSNE